MGCCWPFCGPCLYSKISARVSWPSTKLEALGDTPFKQWFRISLILVLIYWFASWGESMMAEGGLQGKPHFSPMSASDAELNDFKELDRITEAAITKAAAKMEKNSTLAKDIAAIEDLDANVTNTIESDEAAAAKSVEDDAEEMWLGSKDDLKDVQTVADFPEIKQSIPEETVSPLQQAFYVIRQLCLFVWVVLVILLRAHTRKRFDLPAKCCNLDLKVANVNCEDIWCSCCCNPCVLSQMATHTQAVSNEQPMNCCDTTDPGESENCVVAMEESGGSGTVPESTNSINGKSAGAIV